MPFAGCILDAGLAGANFGCHLFIPATPVDTAFLITTSPQMPISEPMVGKDMPLERKDIPVSSKKNQPKERLFP
ncbi:hypothetical protein [Mucilaginibacter sp. 5C4]|uniref:hypothetical protein n=1 Tax=Mucilaginibacter sp. 5C4 TaxID=3048589 RepID=UPI002AC912A6|nr:hypothetical protein [Mucilaginibacter sp. 5C4]WPX23889.1 hypothetical protein RHM67_01165 [Mucilaginibacter sp. 5C4]